MKKMIVIFYSCLICLYASGCSKSDISKEKSDEVQVDTESITESNDTDKRKDDTLIKERKIKLLIGEQEMNITLYDTPVANKLYDMLPLELTFEDFNGIEKIGYLEEKLPVENEPDGYDPEIGDLCYYAPWGNLSIFYQDFGYSDSLIKLGHIDSDLQSIRDIDKNFTVKLQKLK